MRWVRYTSPLLFRVLLVYFPSIANDKSLRLHHFPSLCHFVCPCDNLHPRSCLSCPRSLSSSAPVIVDGFGIVNVNRINAFDAGFGIEELRQNGACLCGESSLFLFDFCVVASVQAFYFWLRGFFVSFARSLFIFVLLLSLDTLTPFMFTAQHLPPRAAVNLCRHLN